MRQGNLRLSTRARLERMTTILKQAAERGEITSIEPNPQVIALPVNLLRHEMLLTRHPVTDHTLTEIVDELFLP